jgi:hypothetical protein
MVTHKVMVTHTHGVLSELDTYILTRVGWHVRGRRSRHRPRQVVVALSLAYHIV